MKPAKKELACITGTEVPARTANVGQAVIGFQGLIDTFVNTVFNYPTLAECYKVAALNGLNRLNYSGEPSFNGQSEALHQTSTIVSSDADGGTGQELVAREIKTVHGLV